MPSSIPPSYSFANSGALIAATLASFLPPPRISVADWAAQSRYLANEGGGYVGRWNHDQAPYLIGPMEALAEQDVVIPGPGQCGKTQVAENWLGQSIETDPADLLWYMQTDASLEAYVKSQIDEKLVDSHAALLARRGLNRSDNSIHFKRFRGMTVEFLSAQPANLINKKAPRIVADEYDAYVQPDMKTLLDVRRQSFGRDSRMLILSHPDRAGGLSPTRWQHGVMAVYADSDRRTWWWRCPDCGMWSSPNPGAAHHMPLTYTADAPLDDIAEHAHLLCPHNGCIITDGQRRGMNLTGCWVGQGEQIDIETGAVTGERVRREIAGFWIVATMSTLMRGGIGGLARDRAAAERKFAITGDSEPLRQVVVKRWGFPYDPPRQISRVDATALADRADPALQLGVVPPGVRFITAAADIQGDRFEMLFRGWGPERESWVIEHRILRGTADDPVSPATSPADWDDMLDQLIDAAFPLADGSGRVMRVRAAGFDSQGEPGVTVQAYAAWIRQRRRRRARMQGTVSGRDTWSLLPLRGASTRGAKNLGVTYPDTARKDRRVVTRGEMPLGIFNPNNFKDALAAQLACGEPGPGYVHFPAGLRSAEPPHSFFEQLVAEDRKLSGEWIKTVARNEATDLMVMAGVMAHLHAPSRFNWATPPSWAADWDRNTYVGAAAMPTPVLTPVAALPARQAAPAPAADDMRSMIRKMMAEMRQTTTEPRI